MKRWKSTGRKEVTCMKRWKSTGRKLAAFFLTMCMTVSAMPVYAQAEVSEENGDMLVHYDFSGLSGGVTDGTEIPDVSGNENHAAAKGNGLTAADGILTLPGGANGSGAGYVELPKGLFDGQKELTVSIWMKNETGAGNYTGFYIGTDANSNGVPTSYFLLNPQNPSRVMKAVLTNTVNESAPYLTEVGPGATNNASDSFVTGDQWALYTVVLTENSITGYLDGEKYKTYETQCSLADFGSDLLSYIGKSPYPDMFYKGGIKDLQVYTRALADDEISELYLEGMDASDILEKAKAEISIPEVTGGMVNCNFVSELTLADSAMNGMVQVNWTSSNPAVISNSGTITDPGEETTVTMTAILSYETVTVEKSIEIKVMPAGETTYSMIDDSIVYRYLLDCSIHLPASRICHHQYGSLYQHPVTNVIR